MAAVSATGVNCAENARFYAVTRISSNIPVDTCASDVCARLGWAIKAANAALINLGVIFFFLLSWFISRTLLIYSADLKVVDLGICKGMRKVI